MKMHNRFLSRHLGFAPLAMCAIVLCGTSSMAQAQLMDQLKGAMSAKSDNSNSGSSGNGAASGLMGVIGGSGGIGAVPSSASSGNIAGVLQFCIKNNYLSGDAASSVKDRIMGKLGGGSATKSPSFTEGAKGILTGSNGQKISLGGQGGLKEKLTHQVCEKILQQGKSLL